MTSMDWKELKFSTVQLYNFDSANHSDDNMTFTEHNRYFSNYLCSPIAIHRNASHLPLNYNFIMWSTFLFLVKRNAVTCRGRNKLFTDFLVAQGTHFIS